MGFLGPYIITFINIIFQSGSTGLYPIRILTSLYLYQSVLSVLGISQSFQHLPIYSGQNNVLLQLHFPFPWLLTMLIIFSYDYWSFAVPFSGKRLLHSLSIFLLGLSFSYWFVRTFNIFWILTLYWLYMLQIFTSVLWLVISFFMVFWWRNILNFKIFKFISLFWLALWGFI